MLRIEPTEPMLRIEPTEPMLRIEPAEPIERIESSDHNDSLDVTRPSWPRRFSGMEPVVARQMWRTLEPYHGMIYFVPEGPAAYAAVGITDTRDGYFASRAAPMGAVPAEVVIATFFNFCPDLVRRTVPRCWDLATPSAVLGARLSAADAALRRLLGDDISSPSMKTAAALAQEAATAPLFVSGRPLYAGHASLPWPSEPHLMLWHAISLLREYRGDGHVAALTVEGISGCEALVTHAAAGDVPKNVLLASRAWTASDWHAAEDRLRARGWLDEAGAFTASGEAMRARVEERTDALAIAPWEHLGEEDCGRLRSLVRPWSKGIVEGGGLVGLGGR